MFKSLVATAVLLAAVYWVAAYSSANGVFKFKRSLTNSNQLAQIESTPITTSIEPTPTPLPPHFPDVEANDLRGEKIGSVSIAEAYSACWPGRREVDLPQDGRLTNLDIENLFGKIRKRELIETTDKGTKWGLLFDESIFRPHAVGSAIEVPTEKSNENSDESSVKTYRDLHLRAAGRMLHCENANSCECL